MQSRFDDTGESLVSLRGPMQAQKTLSMLPNMAKCAKHVGSMLGNVKAIFGLLGPSCSNVGPMLECRTVSDPYFAA